MADRQADPSPEHGRAVDGRGIRDGGSDREGTRVEWQGVRVEPAGARDEEPGQRPDEHAVDEPEDAVVDEEEGRDRDADRHSEAADFEASTERVGGAAADD